MVREGTGCAERVAVILPSAVTCTRLSTACAASHGMLFVPHYVVQCATSVAMSTVLTRLCRSALFPWTAANTHGPRRSPWCWNSL